VHNLSEDQVTVDIVPLYEVPRDELEDYDSSLDDELILEAVTSGGDPSLWDPNDEGKDDEAKGSLTSDTN
jgi:hypothetical protein